MIDPPQAVSRASGRTAAQHSACFYRTSPALGFRLKRCQTRSPYTGSGKAMVPSAWRGELKLAVAILGLTGSEHREMSGVSTMFQSWKSRRMMFAELKFAGIRPGLPCSTSASGNDHSASPQVAQPWPNLGPALANIGPDLVGFRPMLVESGQVLADAEENVVEFGRARP